MLSPTQVNNMLELQSRVNAAVNPDWMNAGYKWHIAAMMEAAELYDMTPWKWWKAATAVSPYQMKLEVIDIWHFALSQAVLDFRNHQEDLVPSTHQIFVDCYALAPAEVGDVQDELCYLIANCAEGTLTLSAVMLLARAVGMSTEEIYQMYMGKAALNLFRQSHGYKQGSYIKEWAPGREDNSSLEEVMTLEPDLSLDDILTRLEVMYASVVKNQAAT